MNTYEQITFYELSKHSLAFKEKDKMNIITQHCLTCTEKQHSLEVVLSTNVPEGEEVFL